MHIIFLVLLVVYSNMKWAMKFYIIPRTSLISIYYKLDCVSRAHEIKICPSIIHHPCQNDL